jgi:DNA-binding transcriptional regulator YiaG
MASTVPLLAPRLRSTASIALFSRIVDMGRPSPYSQREVDGIELRTLRRRSNLDQAGVARALGISVRTVSRWESAGRRKLPNSVTLALESLFKQRDQKLVDESSMRTRIYPRKREGAARVARGTSIRVSHSKTKAPEELQDFEVRMDLATLRSILTGHAAIDIADGSKDADEIPSLVPTDEIRTGRPRKWVKVQATLWPEVEAVLRTHAPDLLRSVTDAGEHMYEEEKQRGRRRRGENGG